MRPPPGVAQRAGQACTTSAFATGRSPAASLGRFAMRNAEPAPAARRSAIALTDDGRALRARATAARLGWLGGVVRDWPEEDVHDLAAALARFADAVGGGPALPASEAP